MEWRNDLQVRRRMITKIARIIKSCKTEAATSEWMLKLPVIARRFEAQLAKRARSLEEYRDVNTLKRRLRDVSVVMCAEPAPRWYVPDLHFQTRADTKAEIKRYLETDGIDAAADVIEEMLAYRAATFAEYMDEATFAARLRDVISQHNSPPVVQA
ncbi:hypothetical protein CTAYLR_000084 [Chrysophaeum taylorii]|uniref:Uncharacterized protein n=1 Tax=Chrysophaeum taylorii TaxID=2483200 RepID=A0AAD7UJ02_9STRA|nr:hypothetical protein CTAYLR_000084 [Chrysophaeum taylorii]